MAKGIRSKKEKANRTKLREQFGKVDQARQDLCNAKMNLIIATPKNEIEMGNTNDNQDNDNNGQQTLSRNVNPHEILGTAEGASKMLRKPQSSIDLVPVPVRRNPAEANNKSKIIPAAIPFQGAAKVKPVEKITKTKTTSTKSK